MIRDLLANSLLPRDAIPYTDEFKRLKVEFETRTGESIKNEDFWLALSYIGKQGGLGKKGIRKKAPPTPSLTNLQQLEIMRLMPEGIGKRDQLPYTPLFNELHKKFHRFTGTKLTKHQFWRSVSRIGKQSRKPKPLFDTVPLGGLQKDIVQQLERTNRWWKAEPSHPDSRFRRWAFDEILLWIEDDCTPIVAIRGPRQVGKSTIQEQLVEHLLYINKVPQKHIFRVQFDDTPSLGQLINPIEAVVRWYEDHVLCESINSIAQRGDRVYLLFDEVQDLKHWSVQLKALSDPTKASIFITGSSSLRLAEGRENLAGRMTTIELGPLRLYEIAGIRQIEKLSPFAPNVPLRDWTQPDFWIALGNHCKSQNTALKNSFKEFSKLGGYPRCHSSSQNDPSYWGPQIVDTVVNKTIEHESNIKKSHNKDIIREVYRRICRYAGQPVKPDTIAKEMVAVQPNIRSSTVSNAIQFLSDTMLIKKIEPLELLLKKQKYLPKYCICDHFIRNAWLQETIPINPDDLRISNQAVSTSAGHLIESIIGYYLSGIPNIELSWFPERKNEPEVDFVITIGLKRIPIEVKYKRGPLEDKDFRGIRSFCSKEHYESPFGLVITQDTFRKIDKHIIAIPASYLLLVR